MKKKEIPHRIDLEWITPQQKEFVIRFLARLEQSGRLYEWIEKYYPEFCGTGTVASFTICKRFDLW